MTTPALIAFMLRQWFCGLLGHALEPTGVDEGGWLNERCRRCGLVHSRIEVEARG